MEMKKLCFPGIDRFCGIGRFHGIILYCREWHDWRNMKIEDLVIEKCIEIFENERKNRAENTSSGIRADYAVPPRQILIQYG